MNVKQSKNINISNNTISNNENICNNENNQINNNLSLSPKYNIVKKRKYLNNDNIDLQVEKNSNISLDNNLEEQYNDYIFDLEIKTSTHLSAKQYLLIIPITNFFKKARNLYILYNVLKCKSVISLRLIEFFVVNYVLDNNTHFNLTRYKSNKQYLIDNLFKIKTQWDSYNIIFNDVNTSFYDLFMIHDNYKCKLKEYNKKNFDPFCRWQRIIMIYEKKNILQNDEIITIKEKSFETTVAQLNFFKWIIENHILDYIIENFEAINKSMNEFEKEIKRNKYRITKANNQNITHDNLNITHDNLNITHDNQNIIHDNLNITHDNLNITHDNQNITHDNQDKYIIKPDNLENKLSILDLQNIKRTKKKEVIYCNADKKTNKKNRVKKEFTKTNRNIMKYDKEIILKFD